MTKLALLGGTPIRRQLFPLHNTIGLEEKQAALVVLESGNLSQFIGAWGDDFYGGPKVVQFEVAWAKHACTRYAYSVNSNTSGLFAAIGACDIGPGDEVIVAPYTMSASAIAPVIYGAVPVFADVDPRTFCLDPKSIEEKITLRTKAILVVHIFGHPAEMSQINALAKRYNIRVIEDCAQAPASCYHGKPVGGLGDLGVFSLNYHKHIHTGEGGVITTDNETLAEKVALIRNHGEQVVEAKGTQDLINTFGFNFRLTELQAAIGIEQLKKLPSLMQIRRSNSEFLSGQLGLLPGITPPHVAEECVHSYYVQPFLYDADTVGVPRDTFVKALQAELPSSYGREKDSLIGAGYVRPLYLQPIYQHRIGRCAFNCPRYEGSVSYQPGLCPVAERLHFAELFTLEYNRPGMTKSDLQDVVDAFEKVYTHRNDLRRVHE
ncbi:MAG: DegT/DnrJ/EryC1/StrS family aminotransferase [Verrucomicrobia bacterium]|nr:DegT/DnrJ/EryC1/StrS family aminotransferase [Verrucomicrobiota bacterium]MBV8277408.1 DegT/DnrJ/EryC1/StrS family aminotransferase [Verrucomicrobiota bacterium]